MSEIKQALFLVAEPKEDTSVLMPLKNQRMTTEDGKAVKVDHTLAITPRSLEWDFVPKAVYATDILTKRPQGWYAAGADMYMVADDTGMIVSHDFKDDKHKEYVDAYKKFKKGGATASENPKKRGGKITLLRELQNDSRLTPPTIEDDGWYVDEGLWYYMLRCFKKRKNVLFVGASGSGKTELIRFLMSKLNKTINIFDMAVSNPNKTFCGNLRASNGSTSFQLARFAQVIQDEGLVLMDELSRAAPSANNIFLPLLDGRRTLYVEDATDPKDRQIGVNPDCAFWATANIGAEFIGTNALDHALLNRFQQVGVSYPPKDKEALLLVKRFGVTQKEAEAMVEVAHNIRNNDDLSKDISTRQLFEVAETVADGYNLVDAFTWTILQQFEDSMDGGERATVNGIIQAM
tara:strand:+ start:62833 stop:64047 length:1215 start_codon:yes stop_codon:yes gene_type:complete